MGFFSEFSRTIAWLPTSLQIQSIQDFDLMFQLRTRQFLKSKELLKDEKDYQYFLNYYYLLIEGKTQYLSVLKINGTYSKQLSENIFTKYSDKTWVS